jgi:alanine dehydrogenase
MIIGVVKEIKPGEGRVGITPDGVKFLVSKGHTLLIQKGAGIESGFSDEVYLISGGVIKDSAKAVFDEAAMIVKVKEPQPQEIALFKKDQILFTYLHLAANLSLAKALAKAGVVAFGYENVELKSGRLPLLEPMSEIAGKMAAMMGAHYLAHHYQGKGKLFGGAVGVRPAKVVVLGAGNVGVGAAVMAAGMGAEVILMNHHSARLKKIQYTLPKNITTLHATEVSLFNELKNCDLFIGTIYKRGDVTPHFVSDEMVALMQKGSVIVDVSIDQGGCVQTSHPTTHQDPIFIREGVLHYCVANMPGAYPQTATQALTNETLPYIETLATQKLGTVLASNTALISALNVSGGKVVLKEVVQLLANQGEKS